MKISAVKNKKLAKIVFLFGTIIIIGLVLSGCVSGIQPVGWSGGAIADNTLSVGSQEGRLVIINLDNGSRQWSEPLRAQPTGGLGCAGPAAGGGGCASAPAGVAIYGTPAVSGELVYIGGYNGKVDAFNANSLALRWVYPREGYIDPIVGGITVALDRVYFGTDAGKIYSLSAATGDSEWEFQTEDKVWSTPVVANNTVYVGSFDKKFYALDATSGDKKWDFETGGAIISSPLLYNNTVYTGSFDRNLYAINAANGALMWKFQGENWFWAKPAIYNDVIYAGSLDHKVYALDSKTGNKLTEFDLGGPIASSPVLVNNLIIFATTKGEVYKITPDTNSAQKVAELGKEVYGPLSTRGNIVYIHTQDLTLHPIDINTGAKLPTISLKSGE